MRLSPFLSKTAPRARACPIERGNPSSTNPVCSCDVASSIMCDATMSEIEPPSSTCCLALVKFNACFWLKINVLRRARKRSRSNTNQMQLMDKRVTTIKAFEVNYLRQLKKESTMLRNIKIVPVLKLINQLPSRKIIGATSQMTPATYEHLF